MPKGGFRLGAGRPRKLNSEKKMAGTLAPCRANKGEVSDPQGEPTKPDFVAARDRASAEWDRMMPMIVAAKRMSPIYMATFAAYCSCYADYSEAELLKAATGFSRFVEEVTIDGSGQEHIKLKPHPVLKDSRDAQRQMQQHAQQLGITPATVTRVQTSEGATVQAKTWIDALPAVTADERNEGESTDPVH